MTNVYCVIGETGTGKTTSVMRLLENEAFKKEKLTFIKERTTRPIRDMRDTDSLIFHTDEELNELLIKSKESVVYTADNGWRYAYLTEDFHCDDVQNIIIITNPQTALKLKAFKPDQYKIVQFKTKERMKTLFRTVKRAINMESSKFKNVKEAFRRYMSDKRDFKNVKCDYVINSDAEMDEILLQLVMITCSADPFSFIRK